MTKALLIGIFTALITSPAIADNCKPGGAIDACHYAKTIADQLSQLMPIQPSDSMVMSTAKNDKTQVQIGITISEGYRQNIVKTKAKYRQNAENNLLKMIKNFSYQFVCGQDAPRTVGYLIKQHGSFLFEYHYPDGSEVTTEMIDFCY